MKNALIPFTRSGLSEVAVLASILLFTSCAPSLIEAPEELPPFSESLVQCTRWMDGNFKHETPPGTSDVEPMQLNQVRIWPERTDGIWIYSELLAGSDEDRSVLHQLIYRAQDDPSGGILITPYLLPGDSSRFIGAWSDSELFDRVDAYTLDPKAGCAMRLRRMPGGSFKGGSIGTNCSTKRRGATRMTESLRVGSLELLYGMEGFDQSGRSVFGWAEPIVLTRSNATEEPRTIKPGTDKPTDLKMYNMDSPSD